MIRYLTVASVILALLALPPGRVSAQSVDVPATCVGKSGGLTATVRIQALPAALEVDLAIANHGQAAVQFDPSKAVLRTAEFASPPLSAAETKRVHRDYGAYMLTAAFLGALLPLTIIGQLNFNRYIDSRAFPAGEIPPDQMARGSLFFPLPQGNQSRAALELRGLGGSSALKVYCPLPRNLAELNETPAFPPLTVSVDAHGRTGPIEVSVETVEFWSQYTAIELSIANRSQAGAEIFMAMANASLRDADGIVHPGQIVRSEFVDRIPPTGSIAARLVFAPLPPTTTAAALRLPGMWFGPEDSVDVTVELKF